MLSDRFISNSINGTFFVMGILIMWLGTIEGKYVGTGMFLASTLNLLFINSNKHK